MKVIRLQHIDFPSNLGGQKVCFNARGSFGYTCTCSEVLYRYPLDNELQRRWPDWGYSQAVLCICCVSNMALMGFVGKSTFPWRENKHDDILQA